MLNLNKLLKKWQKILRLQGWNITVKWGTSYDMQERFGRTKYSRRELHAEVLILREEDFDPNHIMPYDAEETLVHELLHLHIASFQDESPENDIVFDNCEQAINIIANALINRDRHNN